VGMKGFVMNDSIAYVLPDVAVDQGAAPSEFLEKLAGNTGNLLFLTSPAEYFEYGTTIRDLIKDPIPENVKTIVISFGNWISPAVDMGAYAAALENSQVERLVMMGAGVQSRTFEGRISLQAGTRRFLDIVAERSTTIGVRGEFTAEALAHLGIFNVEVVGCPSVLLMDRATLRCPPETNLRVTVNSSWDGWYRDGISELLRFGYTHDAMFVEQSEVHIINLSQTKQFSQFMEFITRYYSDGNLESWRLHDWMKRRAVCFTRLVDWRSALSFSDLSIGSRFHGNLVAMLAGARALFLTMDTRTRELADYFNLPQMRLEDFDARLAPETYFERADPSLFFATLSDRKERFCSFLRRNGLTPAGMLADCTIETLRDPEGAPSRARADHRLAGDIARLKLPQSVLEKERLLRAQPLRGEMLGAAIEASEFVLPYAERIGEISRIRLKWRQRQRVCDAYAHQALPVNNVRGHHVELCRYVSLNAARIAEVNRFKTIIELGYESSLKLCKYFSSDYMISAENPPPSEATQLRKPKYQPIEFEILHPDLFDADIVICSNVLEHILEPDRLLSAMAASAAKIFLFSSPALEILDAMGLSSRSGPPHVKSRFYEWTTSQFAELVNDHLVVIAHTIVDLANPTQFCVAIRPQIGISAHAPVLPELICALGVSRVPSLNR
jgi:hypothetical protein